MTIGIRFVFKQLWSKTSGWSMQFWNSAPTLDAGRAVALAAAQTVYAPLGASVLLKYARIHDADNPRRAITVNFPPLTGYNPNGPDNTQNSTPLIAVLIQCFSADFALKAEYEMRGVVSLYLTKGGLPSSVLSTSGSIANLKAMLMGAAGGPPGAGGWLLRGLDPNRSGQTIRSISAGGVVTLPAPLDFTGAATLNGNPLVYLERVKLGIKARKFQVQNIAGNTFQIIAPQLIDQDIAVTKASRARPVKYAVAAIKSIDMDTITTHKVGRPLDLSTGHRIERAI